MRNWVRFTHNWKLAPISAHSIRGFALALASVVSLALTSPGCSKNYNLDSGNIGVNVSVAAGDKQVANVSSLFPSTLSIRVTDSVTDESVKFMPITFSQTTDTDAIVLRTTATTDEFGIATTQVRSASTFNQSIVIRAQVQGSSTGVDFNLKTSDTGMGSQFIATTSHGNIETAGVPFSFIIKVVDEQGNLVTSYNKSLTLYWSFVANKSWMGSKSPILPTAAYLCTFTNGICQTDETYYFTDSLNETSFSVGDGPGGLTDVYKQTVTVISGPASKLAVATLPGGPKGVDGVLSTSDDATAYASTLTYSADDSAKYFYAAITDSVGNYLQDVTSGGSWATTSESPANTILPYISTITSSSTQAFQFTPTKRGTAVLSLSKAGLTTASINLFVNPGVPRTLTVGTERSVQNLPEQPGVMSILKFTVIDQKGNIVQRNYDGSGGFTGLFPVQVNLLNAQSGPAVGGGCPNILLTLGNYSGDVWGTTYCNGRLINQTFFDGVSVDQYTARFTDATNVSPSITASLTGAPLWPNLSGASGVLPISVGSPTYIEFHSANDGTGSLVCSLSISHGFGVGYDCLTLRAGDPAIDMYAALVDAGGNVINYPTNVTWTGQGTLASQVSVIPSNPSNYAKLTPTIQTGNNLTVTDSVSGVTTNWFINIGTAALHHYNVIADDGLNSANTVSVLRNFTLKIQAMDSYNNVIPSYTGAHNLTITTTFQDPAHTSSPKGTAAVVPASGSQSYSFVAGVVSLTGMKLPNANNNVTFQVTDGTHSSTALNVQVLAGPAVALKVRDSFSGGGNDLTGATTSTNTDLTPAYYTATYDAETNYLASPSSNWTWTGGASVTVTTPGPSTVLTPNTTGTGVLKAVDPVSGLQAQTGTFTILPGAFNYISFNNPPNPVTAGTPMAISFAMKDNKGNILTNYNGNLNLSFAVSNTSQTVYGYDYSIPANGTYSFTNGVITTPLNITLYNSGTSPSVLISDSTFNKTGLSSFTVNPATFDHLGILRPVPLVTTMTAGTNLTYSVRTLDYWGNSVSSGAAATAPLTVSFTSALGGQDIVSTSLTGAASMAGASDTSASGTLTAGEATVQVTATQTGTLSMTASINGGGPTPAQVRANNFQNMTVQPVSTVNSIAWQPAPVTPYSASATTPMTSFSAALKDVYGNTISTNTGDAIVLSMTGGTGSLGGTTTQNTSAGISNFSNITYPVANESLTLTATHTLSGKTVSQVVTINAGAASQAIAILPCQTYNGSGASLAAAVTGTAFNCAPYTTTPLKAGDSFTVTLRAVDQGYNTVTTYNGSNATIALKTSSNATDPNFVPPAMASFVSGVKSYTATVTSAGTGFKILPNTGLGTNVLSSAFDVNPGTGSKIILVMPGQTLNQGATSVGTSRTGTPTAINAGTSFNVTAYATDNYYNIVSDSSTSVTVSSSSDSFWNLPTATKTLSSGSITFAATMYKAQTTATISASSSYGTNVATSNFTISPLTATQAIAILPNQTLNSGAPNLAAAITGTPFNSTWNAAGASFNVTVYAVDQYFNPVTSYVGTSGLTTVDANDTEPTSAAFSSGQVVRTVTNVTADQTLSYTVTPTSALTNVTSSTYNIVPGTSVRTLVLLPNQTLSPGHVYTSGVSGTPFSGTWPTAGGSFTASIVAIDSWSNQTTATTSVGLTSSDGSTTFSPAGSQNLVGGTISYTVNTYTAGNFTLTATNTGGLTNTASTTYTVNPGAAAQIAFTTQPANPSVAGAEIAPIVKIQDSLGNTVTGDNSSTITISKISGTGTLNGTLTKTVVAGVANFTGSGINITTPTTDSKQFQATASPSGYTANSSTFALKNATAHHFVVSGIGASVVAGSTQSATVLVQDVYNNTATDYAGIVHFTTNQPTTPSTATLPSNYTFVAGTDLGTHTFTNGVALNVTGTWSVTATDTVTSSITGSQTGIAVTPDAANKLAFTTQPTAPPKAGVAFAQQPVVQIQDQWGNLISSSDGQASATVTLSAYDGSGCSSATATGAGWNWSGNGIAASNGVATFSTLSYSKAGTFSFKATSGALTTACTSSTIAIVADNAHHLKFTQQSTSATAGATFGTATLVEIRDQYDNVKTASDTITLSAFQDSGCSSTPGTGTLSNGSLAASSGIATFNSLNYTKAETIYLKATDSTTGGVATDCTGSSIVMSAGTATQLAFTTQPGGGGAATAWSTQPVVTIQDAYGNTITSGADSTATVTVSLTTGTGTLSGTTTKTAVAGVADFSGNGLKINLVGTDKVLTASATLNSVAKTTTSNSFTITSGPATQLVLSGAASVIIGNNYSVTVTAQDAQGNTATSYAGTVQFTSTDGSATLPAAYTFVPASDNGVKTFTTVQLVTAGSRTITATDTVTSSITGTSSSITVQNPATLTISDGATYDFGDVVRNSTYSKTHSFTIQNTGDVQATSLAGAALSAPYSYAGGTYPGTSGTCGTTLNAAATCTVNVTLAPTSSASFNATLTLNYNNGISAQSSQRNMTGMGVAISQVVTGNNHACSLFDSGKIKCWGSNSYGQLGNNSTGNGTTSADSASPVAVSGITTATSIAAGDSHTCALISGGTIKCWGRNNLGQLGNNTTTDSTSPVTSDIGSSTASAVTTGANHTCAVLAGAEAGQVKCWGSNSSGQLGIDPVTTSATTGGTAFLSNVSAIAAGTAHTCALLSTGGVQCWGSNANGQLGDASAMVDSFTPVSASGISTATQITSGANHSCAILFDGVSQYTAQCWGAGGSYRLGNGATTDTSTPVGVGTLTTVSNISAGSQHTCLTLASGAVRCFGDNTLGQIGDGNAPTANSSTTTDIISSGVSSVASGGAFTCAQLSNQSIQCWGSNANGQTGNGNLGTTQINTPNLIPSGL